MTNQKVIQLYRTILKHGKLFPSIKRNKILEEIKSAFRFNRNETDETKLRLQISLAEKSIKQLQSYTSLSNNNRNWSVNMDNNPMPSKKT